MREESLLLSSPSSNGGNCGVEVDLRRSFESSDGVTRPLGDRASVMVTIRWRSERKDWAERGSAGKPVERARTHR